MQIQVDIGFENLVKIVKQLPQDQLLRLKRELEKESVEDAELKDLRSFLLDAPVFTDEQVATIEQTRKEIDKWQKLKLDSSEHEVYTVTDKGWNGVKNGDLLKLLVQENFDALLTFDKNLLHQQNFKKYTIKVFVLSAPINPYQELSKLTPRIKEYIKNNDSAKGPVIVVS